MRKGLDRILGLEEGGYVRVETNEAHPLWVRPKGGTQTLLKFNQPGW